MTHDTPPKRIWVSAPNEDNEVETWTDPDEGGTEYILASEHAALIREAKAGGGGSTGLLKPRRSPRASPGMTKHSTQIDAGGAGEVQSAIRAAKGDPT